jgi:hypothetical protein
VKRYSSNEIVAFFEYLDTTLDARMDVFVIGGAVLGIAYALDRATKDCDVYQSPAFASAARRARHSPHYVPVDDVSVAELPYHFDLRVERVLRHLRHLHVFVPEKHDYALSKLARGGEADLQAIESLHECSPLDCEMLLTRYIDDMRWYLGGTSHQIVDANVLECIDTIFDTRRRAVAAARLAANRRRY